MDINYIFLCIYTIFVQYLLSNFFTGLSYWFIKCSRYKSSVNDMLYKYFSFYKTQFAFLFSLCCLFFFTGLIFSTVSIKYFKPHLLCCILTLYCWVLKAPPDLRLYRCSTVYFLNILWLSSFTFSSLIFHIMILEYDIT